MKKTQALVVMSFVIAIALAVGFYMQMLEEKTSRVNAENMLSSVIKERDILEIAYNRKIQEKEKLIAHLSASLSKEKTINLKLAENLERSVKRFTVVSRPKKPVELEKIIVSSLLEAEGRVLAVDRQNDIVVINLGAVNNLKSGDRLSIYRGDNFIANAELVKVQNKISAAMLLSQDKSGGMEVKVNDTVK